MKLFLKLQGGALQFVLFIGAVIAVLLLTFVLLTHSHLFFAKKTVKFIEVIKQNDFALDNALHNNTSSNLPDAISNGIASTVKKEYWGVFEKYTIASSFEKYNFESVALVGTSSIEALPALFLKDNKRPLVIVGNSKITGPAFLPEQGIKLGNIAGESYFGNRLVYGPTKRSSAALPQLNAEIKKNRDTFCSQNVGTTQSRISLSKNTVLKNSFLKPTQVVFGDVVDLSGVTLIGNIQVIASQAIRVDARTVLSDVILSAPSITIGDNFVGSFQAFASMRISVGRNASLEYPTALVVKAKKKIVQKRTNTPVLPSILIERGALIKGVVLYNDKNEERQFYPQVKLEQGATILGQVYNDKNIELKGNILGSLYTDGFMALENGNIYQNHLYKGTINSLDLQEQFAGIPLGGEASFHKKVMKWLY